MGAEVEKEREEIARHLLSPQRPGRCLERRGRGSGVLRARLLNIRFMVRLVAGEGVIEATAL